MTVTTTAFSACGVVAELDDETGAPVNVSGSANKLDANFDNRIGEFRTFENEWMSRIQCGKDAAVSLRGVASTGTDELRDLVEGWYFDNPGPRTFAFRLPTGAVGGKLYSGEYLLKTFKFSADAGSGDPMMYEIDLVPNGPVVRTTIT